jgi:hypothetical protein
MKLSFWAKDRMLWIDIVGLTAVLIGSAAWIQPRSFRFALDTFLVLAVIVGAWRRYRKRAKQ